MERKSEILDKIGRHSGMTVPEGYFPDFASRMAASLPPIEMETADAPVPVKRTFWQRVRPYAYMAAMFAGIWCMMKMLSLMQNDSVDLSIDNYPGVVTALSDDNFVKDYVYPDIDEYDMMDDLYDSGLSAEDIFYYDEYDEDDPDVMPDHAMSNVQ